MNMIVALAADHGGFTLKIALLTRLQPAYQVADLGAFKLVLDDDYPDFAKVIATAVTTNQADRGILICGSGVGACIAANKIPGARASLCHDTYSAHQGVEHDNMNILCLGARVIGVELAYELAMAFLEARFLGEDRFRRRLDKILSIERRALQGRA